MLRSPVLAAALLAISPAVCRASELLAVEIDGTPCPNGSVRLLAPVESVLVTARAEAAPAESVALVEAGEAGTTFVHRHQADWQWTVSEGRVQAPEPGTIRWFPPPEGGLCTFQVSLAQASAIGEGEAQRAAASAEFGLLAPAAFDRNGDGRIGQSIVGIYPNENAENAPAVVARNRRTYAPPAAFYRLDAQSAQLELAPGFTLGALNPEVLPAEGDRYVAMKAEVGALAVAVAGSLADGGMPAGSLKILRGYVSPQERARLQRMGITLAEFTRFQYGDCVALIVDRNGDFRMDDLNADGSINRADAAVLADRVEVAMGTIGKQGGIGVCSAFEGPNHIGTPYVQTDLRGWLVRWEE